ncbi:hypothetical protein BGW36DRAFT_443882 [Talaromyces proteolyticus]|uniref:CHAT domain-containing protein n=1 Tax=Talaromyces proteolyticus TaxID=1131652 RepID=A0AAD4L4T3_9EURO|nr:uncharacterized protein BGW36DRAFT_443882 [Talaromyces proteolyticus]KAH8703572.1 hypothetical protein BGW36DRAFT_443882 [Talaromyces proteolyticus]
MSKTIHIWCQQAAVLSPRSWKVAISSTDCMNKTIDLENPSKSQAEDNLVRWYLEDFTLEPFAKYRARAAAAELRRYGILLWNQLDIGSSLDGYATVILHINLSQDQHELDRIHWEVLEHLDGSEHRVIVHRELRTPALDPLLPSSTQAIDGVFRILVVSARSDLKKGDVPPRLTSLPLVRTLEGAPGVELAFVHTGTFQEFEKALDERSESERIHLVHFDLHGKIDKNKGPVLEFTEPNSKYRTAYTASSVANVLRRNGVEWTVLCACRTAQTTSTFGHLALHFLTHGIRGVYAMRYELKASGAAILTSSFYTAFCLEGKTFVEAAYASRRAMQADSSRRAKYGELVEIQDSLVPAVYIVDGVDLRLAGIPSKPEIARAYAPSKLPEIIGREDDIHRLSRLMRGQTSFQVLIGDIGTGKSLLMKHLAWWWKQIHLFQNVVYVNVSLIDTDLEHDSSVGLHALAKFIRNSVIGDNAAHTTHPRAIDYIREMVAMTKGHDYIILVDGIDELFHESSKSDDTLEGWTSFFRVVEILSVSSLKFIVATCSPSICSKTRTDDNVFSISRQLTTTDAQNLISSFKLQTQETGSFQESPDTHLLRIFEMLQYNPMVMKSLSSALQERFHGLETILSWSQPTSSREPNDGENTFLSYIEDIFENKINRFKTLDLDDSEGLGRVHQLMLTVLAFLGRHNRYQEIWALLSIGLWTDVLPHPDAIVTVFEVKFSMMANVPMIGMIIEKIPKVRLGASFLPFKLWSIMNEGLPPESEEPQFSKEAMARSLKYVVRLLLGANLLTTPTEPLIDGTPGYHIHPALTLWIRRILRILHCDGVFISFFDCIENRALEMAKLNPAVTEDIPAIKSFAFPFIQREKWNLITAVVGLHQKYRHLLAMITVPAVREMFLESGMPFAWSSFHVLAPICGSTEDFCTWFLTHIVLEYIDMAASIMPNSMDEPLLQPLGPFLYLLNWAIDMTQRYCIEAKRATPLRLRKLLLGRVSAMRRMGTGKEELMEDNFKAAEMKALISEMRIALMSPNSSQDDIDRSIEAVKTARAQSEDGWSLLGSFLNDVIGLLNNTNDSTVQLEDYVRKLREDRARRPNTAAGSSFEDEFATQSVILDMMVDNFLKPFDGLKGLHYVGNPVNMAWYADLIFYMHKVDFFQGIPPWYSDLIAPILTHTRQGDLAQAIAAARRGLQVAERDGHVLVASKFRQVCRRLGELDVADDYDAHQAMLSRVAENSSLFLRQVLDCLAKHDTPAAYRHAKQACDEMQFSKASLPLMKVFGKHLSPLFASMSDNLPQLEVSFNGLERLVEFLEPYKEVNLEDKREWVDLVWKIRNLLTNLTDQSRSMDMEWAYKASEVFNDPNQLANEIGVDAKLVKGAQEMWSNVFKAGQSWDELQNDLERVTEVHDQATENMGEDGAAQD